MIRRITFASCYVYSPLGSDLTSERSRLLRAMLKARDARFMPKYAHRVRQQVAEPFPLAGYFGDASVLIPIPGSRPGVRLSVTEQLALALLRQGLGCRLWAGLHRARSVPKSATAACGTRPTVGTHYDSFAIDPVEIPLRHIVLVDDVVTKGRTLLAAASRLQDAFPDAQIRAFALVRTMGLVAGVDRLIDPCVGEISWRAGDARREP